MAERQICCHCRRSGLTGRGRKREFVGSTMAWGVASVVPSRHSTARRADMRRLLRIAVFIALLAPVARSSAQPAPARVTILYDAIGKSTPLKHGWGYSALIEYGGRRILFDTGGRVDDFASNVNALGVDLVRLDFVVLSHPPGGPTPRLNHLLQVQPRVPVSTPPQQHNIPPPSAPAL